MRLCALLLLLLGSSLGVSTQLPELIQEEEGSGPGGSGGIGETPLPEPVNDTYWSGTAPLCLGGCHGRHQELKRDRCGDSDCCWFGYKSLCRVNCGRPDVDFNGAVFGNDWWVGSVVRYTCRAGFLLVGDPARACQSNGRWTPKPFCLRVCRRGSIDVNERDLDGFCSSSCPSKSYVGPPKHGCSRIDNCRKKESAWNGWFTGCDSCQCDCSIACASAG
ncbi:CUB and sushi domain-containing protein 3 [Hypomesus transpacificus]|uniref:CUB and sushi domain-containing protein 3 n=1 Tax=Hypomesus transpacificus TaxID=137520 RepID=UPI001F078199|nr:CUB and sushi domain-containing protein 3 [Hypomesus transpacificus]